MNFTLFKQAATILLLLEACHLSGCQQTEERTGATATEATASTNAAQAAARPAPDFFVIPPDMAGNRVWLCVDEASDVFHTKHDCPVLVQCKGSFRNVTLVRAVEDFGRYNCQACSQHLDHIFDENMVR